jgi:hypothetical protein
MRVVLVFVGRDQGVTSVIGVGFHERKITGALFLLRMDTGAGRGLGKPTPKVIDELSDIYAFLFTVCRY